MQNQRRAIEGEGSMAWNVQEPGVSQAPLPESDFSIPFAFSCQLWSRA